MPSALRLPQINLPKLPKLNSPDTTDTTEISVISGLKVALRTYFTTVPLKTEQNSESPAGTPFYRFRDRYFYETLLSHGATLNSGVGSKTVKTAKTADFLVVW